MNLPIRRLINSRSCSARFVPAVAGALFGVCAAKADPPALQTRRVPLLSQHPTPSFQTLDQPISTEFLLAGIHARDRKLKSGTATAVHEKRTLAAYAQLRASLTGQPAAAVPAREDEIQSTECRWWMSGNRLRYTLTGLTGNTIEANSFRNETASYNGKEWRSFAEYKNGFKTGSIDNGWYGFSAFYDHDPRFGPCLWVGHVDNFPGQLRRLSPSDRIHVAGIETLYASPCYRIDIEYADGKRWHLWADVEHDLLFRRHEFYDRDRSRLSLFTAPRIRESNGVWMVTEWSSEDYARARPEQYVLLSQERYTVNNFAANTTLQDAAFELKFPPGTEVQNTETHQVYVVRDEGIASGDRDAAHPVSGVLSSRPRRGGGAGPASFFLLTTAACAALLFIARWIRTWLSSPQGSGLRALWRPTSARAAGAQTGEEGGYIVERTIWSKHV